jgi:Icc-related predicted phosphoesterase
MIRIQYLSDLHLEAGWSPADAARERGLHIDDVGADVIVLAGDTAEGAEGIAWAARQWPATPVVYVLGNHDPALSSIDETLADCRAAAAGTTVHVLEREATTIAGVRILGATLWTDFLLHGDAWATEARAAASRSAPEYRSVRGPGGGRLTPSDTVRLHEQTVRWLETELVSGDPACTVVVSHHAPSPRSLRPGWQTDLMSAAFASDLECLVERYAPVTWIHGHVHAALDYRLGLGATRVLCNPAGYPRQATGWDPACCIEIGEARACESRF